MFDAKKLQREVEKQAGDAFMKAAERARRSLGADGEQVRITRLSTPRRQGTNLTFGEVSCPSEEVKRRFERALARELR
jgi:hypothetical protein